MKRLGTPHKYGENWSDGSKYAVLLDRSEKVEFTAQVDYRMEEDGKMRPFIRIASGALFLEEDAKAELIEWAEDALRKIWGATLDVVIATQGPPPDWSRVVDPADEEPKASREPDPEAMQRAREEVEALGGKVSL